MDNNVICKAKFKSIGLGLIIVYVIIFILANLFTFETQSHTEYEVDNMAMIQRSVRGKGFDGFVYREDKPPLYKEERYRLWWKDIATKTYDVRKDINREEGLSFETDYLLIMIGIMIIPPLLIILVFSSKSRKSKLELTDEKINATNKKMFSTENINLPIDKVENAIVKKNLYNILTGGQTVVICSSSEKIKFTCVRNADEFAQAVRKKIDEVKNSK